MEKSKKIKSLGMVHIPGVNDDEYHQHIRSLPVEEDSTAMMPIVANRW